MVVPDQIPCFAGITDGILRTDSRYLVDVVQQVKGIADAAVDVIVCTAARTVRRPSAEIGDISILLTVDETLAGKPVGCTHTAGYHVVAGELIGRPVISNQVGHVSAHVVAVFLGLLRRFPNVVLRGLAFGNDIEVFA